MSDKRRASKFKVCSIFGERELKSQMTASSIFSLHGFLQTPAWPRVVFAGFLLWWRWFIGQLLARQGLRRL